jgi:CAAX prenyl protease-like protein
MFGLNFRRAAFVRAAPFAVFMGLLFLRQMAPEDGSWGFDTRWLYALKLVFVGGLLLTWWRDYGELGRQSLPTVGETLTAVAVGAAVFGLWIQLDAPWMTLNVDAAPAFVGRGADGQLQWPLIAVRTLGAAVLVPLMEELFWRSFLMRWVQDPVFEGVSPAAVGVRAIVISTFLFVLAHTLWLAAIVAGLAYALLYVRSGKLWLAVIAHGVTNGALAAWVVATGNWQFW